MRLEKVLSTPKKKLITFITAGHPTIELSRKAMDVLVENGADILEIGFPFSDPMADGPVIEKASMTALKQGMCLDKTLSMIKDFRASNQETPIILMGYYNPIYKMGVDVFLKHAREAGVDGLILVDLPLEEEAELTKSPFYKDISLIHLVTPTTHNERIEKIVQKSSGFLYYVSVAGITGTKQGNKAQIAQHIEDIRMKTSLPIMIGFGIKQADQAAEMAEISDGVVVGSALVSCLDQKSDDQEILTNLSDFVTTLASAIEVSD